jgi:hypothetical protein
MFNILQWNADEAVYNKKVALTEGCKLRKSMVVGLIPVITHSVSKCH